MYCWPRSGPCITVSAPSFFSRATSGIGGSSTMSTSPEISAASRVASERIASQTTSSTLPERLSLQPHQRGFFFSTVRMSGS